MLKDKIKERRKLLKLSQEILAEKVGVSITAIQNWEGGSNVPSIDNIISLETALGLKSKTLLEEYANDIYPKVNKEEDNNDFKDFPYFLFNDEELKEIDDYHLNNDQHELSLLLTLYRPLDFEFENPEFSSSKCDFSPKNKISTSNLPYEYIKECGLINVLQNFKVIKELYKKWNRYSANNLFYYLEKHPERIFDMRSLDIEDLIAELSSRYLDIGMMMWLLSYINNDGLVFTDFKDEKEIESLKEKIINNKIYDYEYSKYLGNIEECCGLATYIKSNKFYKPCLDRELIEIKVLENSSKEYINSKNRYISLLEVYNKTPELYDKKPSFNEEKKAYFFLTDKGQKALNWGKKHKNEISDYLKKVRALNDSYIKDFHNRISY